MVQKKCSRISIVLSICFTVSAQEPPSLFAQVSSLIIKESDLHADVEKYVPEQIKKKIGAKYCKENIVQSWRVLPKITTLRNNFRDRVRGIHFLPDTDVAISVGSQGILRWWDTDSLLCLHEVDTEQKNVRGLALSRGGTRIATAGGTMCKIWDTQTGDLVHMIEHDEEVHSVVFFEESRLVVGGKKGKIWVWDLSVDRYALKTSVVHGRNTQYPLNAMIHAVHLADDGKTLISAQHNSVKQWNIDTQTCTKETILSCKAIPGNAIFIDNTTLLSSFTDGTLIFTDCTTLESQTRTLPMQDIQSVAPSPDGKFLLTGTLRDRVQLWKYVGTSYSLVREFEGGKGFIGHVAFQGDGLGFMAGDNFGVLQYWSMGSIIRSMTLSDAQKALDRDVLSDITESQDDNVTL